VTILVVGAGRGPLVSEAVRAVARVSASLATDRGGDGRRRRPRRALHASIVAIEKNPSAVLYLRGMKCVDPSWNGGLDYDPRVDGGGDAAEGEGSIVIPGTSVVTVIGCDMREAASDPLLGRMTRDETRRADIVVSELLGSFGDNELSPECLDGVQRCGIMKDNCVSIPQR
jgi:protein arginine N-methyltransferase 5